MARGILTETGEQTCAASGEKGGEKGGKKGEKGRRERKERKPEKHHMEAGRGRAALTATEMTGA
jgi:hypothetical protein